MRMQTVVCVWREFDVVHPENGNIVRVKAMYPVKRYRNIADRQFELKEEYPLEIVEARSRKTHNHYFAALHDGFQNLPETISARWPTEEHLRAWLLIETGWFDEMDVTLSTDREVEKLVARVRSDSPYARIHRTGRRLIVQYPKSQSAKAMGAKTFNKSKKDVLELLEHMIGTESGALMKNAGKGP